MLTTGMLELLLWLMTVHAQPAMYTMDEQSVSYVIFVLCVAGFVVYILMTCFLVLSVIAGRLIFHRKTAGPKLLDDELPGVSVIKPLMGVEPTLEVNLESHFTIEYPKMELLFCVEDEEDPAIALVNKLSQKYPNVNVKIFTGGCPGIINPMVNNMVPAYDNAQYPIIWISTSRILARTEVLVDMISKVMRPNVAMCHQMPYTVEARSFAAIVEKINFGCSLARYYIALNVLGMSCTTGMSYVFRKKCLDEINGLGYYGRYLAEDFFVSKKLHDKGHRILLATYPALQNAGNTTLTAHKNRFVRWTRLRLNLIPLVSGILEPIAECLPLGLYGSWCFYQFFGINPYYFFICHVTSWCILDYIGLLNVERQPLTFSKLEYVIAWIVRELLGLVVYFEAIINPRRIKWGPRTFKMSLGGHTELVDDKAPLISL